LRNEANPPLFLIPKASLTMKIDKHDIRIREKTEEDYEFTHNLTRDNSDELLSKYFTAWDGDGFRRDFAKGILKIVEYKGKRVGFFHYEIFPDYAYLHNVQLIPSMQGKGIGTYLLNLIETEVKKRGKNRLRLRVYKENPAVKFYQKLNYTKKTEETGKSLVLEKEF
jgi:GNAT superfamily N-acetyltransferase